MRFLAAFALLASASAFIPHAPLGLPKRKCSTTNPGPILSHISHTPHCNHLYFACTGAPIRPAARVQMLSGDFLEATSNLVAIVKENDVSRPSLTTPHTRCRALVRLWHPLRGALACTTEHTRLEPAEVAGTAAQVLA